MPRTWSFGDAMIMSDPPVINYMVALGQRERASKRALTQVMGSGVTWLLWVQMGPRSGWFMTMTVEQTRRSLSLFKICLKVKINCKGHSSLQALRELWAALEMNIQGGLYCLQGWVQATSRTIVGSSSHRTSKLSDGLWKSFPGPAFPQMSLACVLRSPWL